MIPDVALLRYLGLILFLVYTMRNHQKDLIGSSDGSDEPDDSAEESEQDDGVGLSSSPRKRKYDVDDNKDTERIIVETAFDAYFTRTSSRSQTSTNVFSSLVPPLTAEEYAEGIEAGSKGLCLKPLQSRILSQPTRDMLFSRFLRELVEGFNLLMYGYGSKRRVLNQFATECCAKAGQVIVANAFRPDFALKDLLTTIDLNVPGLSSLPLPSTTLEAHSKRIYDFFASKQRRRLFLIIHNIDAASLRSSRAKSCLSLLALNPSIHIVASVDHINAPLLFSSSESSTRKPDLDPSITHTTPPRGFSFLWHDLTTLEPYDTELAHVDRSSLSGAHGGGVPPKKGDLASQGASTMTETAALHILASVTQKAQKLFILMATHQLGAFEDSAADGGAGANERDLQQFAMGYDLLFTMARDNFIATNDTALRSLLGEFRDHNLVVSAQGVGGAGEVLWIPLRKERLSSALKTLQTSS